MKDVERLMFSDFDETRNEQVCDLLHVNKRVILKSLRNITRCKYDDAIKDLQCLVKLQTSIYDRLKKNA